MFEFSSLPEQKRKSFLRRNLAVISLLGFVFFLGAVCAVCFVGQDSTQEVAENSILTTYKIDKRLMQQYSRVLTVEVSPNSEKLPENAKIHKKIQTENMILNFYPIQKKPAQIIAIQVIDQQESSVNEHPDISKISHEHFSHEVHSPQQEIYFLVLDKRGQFSNLVAEKQVSQKQLEKIKHIVQQYTPELDSELYSGKAYTRETKLGQAKVQHEKVYEDNDKMIVRQGFNGNDIQRSSSFQNLDSRNYQFSQTHHFSKKTNNLEQSDLHEKYHFESEKGDMFTLGLDIQTHQKLQLIKTKEFSEKKLNELLEKYYKMKDNSQVILTLTPNELRHTSDLDFAQQVKDQMFPASSSCSVKERKLQQANDDIQMLTNQTFTVYDHPQQSFLGFTFKIIDEITIQLDKTNRTLLFDNSLILEIQRDTCFKQFTLIEFNVPLTTNFTYDFQYIEASAVAWLENLEDFFKNIYNKFQDFLKKIQAEGIHSNSSWTGIDQNSSRLLSIKSDLDQFEADLSKWNEDIIDTLSHTSKQYHYSKPISYEYNLDFYGITLQFSFGFTFALDGSYEDNLLDLYTYNKQVLINYINILVDDYQDDMEYAQTIWKNLSILLQDCTVPPYDLPGVFNQWECYEDDTELDYSCKNNVNSQKIHITKAYYDYIEAKKKGKINGNCLTQEIQSLEQALENQLKTFYSLRETQFLNLINLTYIPQFKGDVYIQGYVKVTLVPWLNNLAMSVSLSGDLLNAVADVNIYLNVIPFFTNLITLVEGDISSQQYVQDIEQAVSFNFNIDVQVVNITLTWTADTVVVDFVLDVAEVMKNMWGNHSLRALDYQQPSNTDLSVFSDIFSDAASKFEQGLEQVIADIYCEFFTSASGIAEAFTPESVPLYQFLWANAGCNLQNTTLQDFTQSQIQCSYSTAFQVIQLWDPSKYQTSQ